MRYRHPMQPLIRDKHKLVRFKENKIIRWLVDSGKLNLNEISIMDFSKEDRQQLAQLIGYSLRGYSELSYVTDKAWELAYEAGEKLK